MKYKEKEIKNGIKLHTIKTDKFKTNLIAVFLTSKLERKDVTKNALISKILRRGSKKMQTQEKISKQMESMYGAGFDCGLDKTGDNHVLKFYIETVNDQYLPKNNDNILKESIEKILEIVFDPYIEKDGFRKEYVEQEKANLKQRIEGRKDNKAKYSLERCIEEMYPEDVFGLYTFGYAEDLEKINEKNLYEYYKEFIDKCKIDIFVSGDINDEIENRIVENEIFRKLNERNPNYSIPEIKERKPVEKENIVIESMDVTQGKLVLGLDININNPELKYDTLLYNNILGGSANSKMFQNVREKAHLAYVASSSYLRYKNNIFVNCGIEISNYEKALELIRKQIEDMKNGEFTEEDIENNKKGIIATIKTINDEQDTCITYYFGQELSKNKISVEEYMKKIQEINREDILNIAKNVSINTIYFLTNSKENN